MGAGRFVILRKAADQLEVELSGELTERMLVACDGEVRAQLSAARPGSVRVVIDLVHIEGYSIEARDGLVSLQRHLAGKANQTAYVADSPPSRGLALWVGHVTEGQVIKTFARRIDADAWLLGSIGPTTGIRPVARARDGVRQRRKSNAAG